MSSAPPALDASTAAQLAFEGFFATLHQTPKLREHGKEEDSQEGDLAIEWPCCFPFSCLPPKAHDTTFAAFGQGQRKFGNNFQVMHFSNASCAMPTMFLPCCIVSYAESLQMLELFSQRQCSNHSQEGPIHVQSHYNNRIRSCFYLQAHVLPLCDALIR
jgi:hypothetical protein